MFKPFIHISMLVLGLITFPVFSAEPTGPNWLSLISSLVSVIVFIFVLAFVYKKLMTSIPGNNVIKVVSTMPLGTKERLVVIEIDGKQHLLGVTANQVSLLTSFEEPVADSEPLKINNQFAEMLSKKLKL